MARLIAFDWDRAEARIVVARTSGDSVRVDQMVAVPLDLDGQETNLEPLHQQLSKALASQRASKSQALVAVGRSLVELRTMNLPPAPAEELPDMVRFQAMREFSSLSDSSPLDFLPLGDAGNEPGEVMAAAIPAELANHVEAAVTEQGHELHRATMRPCAAASLAMRRQADAAHGVTLIIAQQADSAELIVTRSGTVVFTRSFRLPANWHPGETGEPMLGEVRRTIAAAQNQLGGARVERIVYFGTANEHAALCERLEDRTKLSVTLIDPTEGISIAGESPAQPERFAALLGMLQDEAHDVAPVLDFQNPRQKPAPESNRRLHVLLMATAATIVFAGFSLVYWTLSNKQAEIDELQGTINLLSSENKRMGATRNLVGELQSWKASDHNWLDELVHLSTSKDLVAEDFLIDSLVARARDGFPGLIEITGRAKDLSAQQKLQNELSDDQHDVIPGLSAGANDGDTRYPMAFTTTIRTEQSLALEAPRPKPMAVEPPEANPTDTVDSDSEPADDSTPGDIDKDADATAEQPAEAEVPSGDGPATQDATEDAEEQPAPSDDKA